LHEYVWHLYCSGILGSEMSIGLAFLSLFLATALHETVYNCKTNKQFVSSTLFGYDYSVLQEGDIHVGDTVYTK